MPKNNIEKLRKQRRLTQEQLAEIIGVGRDTLGRYEAEITEMKVSVLIALADYFNVTTDYILGRSTKQFIDRKKVFDAITDSHLKLVADLYIEEDE
ncbi:MAG: helix-turn-helix domain-containing protein [Anaeroplasmataceae bacterium]